MATATAPATQRSPRTVLVRGAAALVVSLVVNLGLIWAAGAAGPAGDFRALTFPPVGFLTTVGVLGATAVYYLLTRRSATPDRTFGRVAALVLVLSFVPDLGLLVGDPAATPVRVGLLMVMHVVVAAACVGALTGRLPVGG